MLIGVNLSYGLTLQDFEKLAIGIGVSYLVLSLLMSFYYLLNGINLLELRQAVDFHVTSWRNYFNFRQIFKNNHDINSTDGVYIIFIGFIKHFFSLSCSSFIFHFHVQKNNTVLFSFFIVSFPAVLFLNIVFPIFDRASLWLNELSPFVWF